MKHSKNSYRNLILISQLGFSVIVPIFLCLFVGVWLDNRFSTWFTIPLLILGFLAGGRNAYIMARDSILMDERDRKKNEKDKRYR